MYKYINITLSLEGLLMTEIRVSRKERHVKKNLFSMFTDLLKKIDFIGIAMYLLFAVVVGGSLWYLFS